MCVEQCIRCPPVQCFSSILAGAGIKGGNVYGKSNKHGEYPTSNAVRPEQLAATIYHALGIPINNPQDASGISRSLTTAPAGSRPGCNPMRAA